MCDAGLMFWVKLIGTFNSLQKHVRGFNSSSKSAKGFKPKKMLLLFFPSFLFF